MLAQLHDEKWVYRIVILISKYVYRMTHNDVTSHWTGDSHIIWSHEKEGSYLNAYSMPFTLQYVSHSPLKLTSRLPNSPKYIFCSRQETHN